MPNPSLYERIIPSLFREFGEDSQSARTMLDFIVHKICLNIFSWPEETSLAEKSCEVLHSLTKNSQVLDGPRVFDRCSQRCSRSSCQ
jgi:hypothetical protein